MELGCLLEYKGDAYFEASLAEPMSCSMGAFHAAFHTKMGVYHHEMGVEELAASMAILAGAGPMGLGAIDYAVHGELRQPASAGGHGYRRRASGTVPRELFTPEEDSGECRAWS